MFLILHLLNFLENILLVNKVQVNEGNLGNQGNQWNQGNQGNPENIKEEIKKI